MKISDPKLLGFDPQRLARIGDVMQRYVDAGKLPGFVTLVARRGEIAYLNTCGWRDVATQRPMQTDTIFRIFSMTKPIASVALLMLYEQGLVNLHDPLSNYLPEFAAAKVWTARGLIDVATPISVQHILTHTAGFTYGAAEADDIHPVDILYAQADLFNRDLSLNAMVEKLATLPLRFQPGTQWHYSMATDVVGRLVEVLADETLADFIEQRICQPLGMSDTTFAIDRSKLERFATLYHITPDDPLAVLDHPQTSGYLPPVKLQLGGSGMVSTIGDYYRFAAFLLNKGALDGVRLLGRKTVERMQMNHLMAELLPIAYEFSPPMVGLGFGLGVGVTLDPALTGQMGSRGGYGWGGYAETTFVVDPQEELIAINMTQCIPSSTYPVRQAFRTAVYQALVD
jgi:CubicO group peptidase (beta-lactamase class C family)